MAIYGEREPEINGAIVAAIQTTFNRSRLSRQTWQSRLLEGRVDARQVWRNDAKGAMDIFRERHAPSVTKVNLFVLVDSSGSMTWAGKTYGTPGISKIIRAQDFAGTLVKAFERIPSVRVQVWQHNALRDGQAHLYRVYARGHNSLVKMLGNVGGGNADGFALQAIGDLALKEERPGEKTIVWMISDGLPSVSGIGAVNTDLAAHSNIVAEALRAKGTTVLGTAIDGFNADFVKMYGPEWIMEFKSDQPSKAWVDLAQQVATVVGRALAPRR